MSVDVIVPAFNAERFLSRTVESIYEQSPLHAVIIVDDGSSDGTLACARACAPSALILTGPNGGVARARNRGIAALDAEWVQFVDSDDILAPQTIARRLEVAAESGADVVVTDWAEFREDADIEQATVTARTADWVRFHRDGAEVACATTFSAPPAALLFRKELVARIGGFRDDLFIIDDARFLFDAAVCGAKFAHARHVGAYYRVQPEGLSRRTPARFWRDVLHNGEQIEALWRARGGFDVAQRKALREIFDGAGRSLFEVLDPSWRQALDGLHRNDILPSRKLHAAQVLSSLLGDRLARHLLTLLTFLRRAD
ncbi:MAG: glycosyltransferase family 2 protein [Alphaproteobacteria bacterium]|nr:glycosyltransferase family 2 protein [Alphaproteobacteria bacterium]